MLHTFICCDRFKPMTFYIMYDCMSRIKHRLRKLIKVSHKEIWLWGFICSQRFKLRRYFTIRSTLVTLGWYPPLSVNSNVKTPKFMKILLCEKTKLILKHKLYTWDRLPKRLTFVGQHIFWVRWINISAENRYFHW